MIRTAEPEDWPVLEPILRQFHAESGMAPLDIDKLRAFTLQQIKRDLVILAERDGVVIGGLGLVEDVWYYSQWSFLRDFFCYIVPEARGGGEFRELTDAAEGIAEAFEEPIFIAVLNEKRASRRIANVFGWVPAGYIVKLGRAIGLPL